MVIFPQTHSVGQCGDSLVFLVSDVFMDERNRRSTLKLLTTVLAKHADSQTIIISPLSLDSVEVGTKVKKIVIRPIDRNQSHLNLV